MSLKLSLNPDGFRSAISRVGPFADESSPLDRFHYVSLSVPADGKPARCAAHNAVSAAVAIVQDSPADGTGVILQQASGIERLAKQLRHVATLTLDESSATLSSPGFASRLPIIKDSIQIPDMSKAASECSISIQQLSHAIRCACLASGRAHKVVAVDCVSIDLNNETISGGDGIQFVVSKINLKAGKDTAGGALLIPVRACKLMTEFFRDDEGLVKMKHTGSHVVVWNDAGAVYLAQASGRFPPADKIISQAEGDDRTILTAEKGDLIRCMDIAMLGVVQKDEEYRHVTIELQSPSEATITGEHSDRGKFQATLECTINESSAADRIIKLDGRRLLTAIRNIPSQLVSLSIRKQDQVALLSGGNVNWIIAPILKDEHDVQ